MGLAIPIAKVADSDLFVVEAIADLPIAAMVAELAAKPVVVLATELVAAKPVAVLTTDPIANSMY